MAQTGGPRVAIVTGVSAGIGGIGRAITSRLLADGLCVLAADIDASVGQVIGELASAIPGATERADHFAGDLAEMPVAAALVAQALRRFGRVDVLVNNAGSGVIRPFLEHDHESLTATLRRNLWTTLACCHAVLPAMVAAGHGRIINIGADSLRTGIPNHAGYNAAKGGVVGLTVGLAREFAGHDICINTVSPCVVNTERMRAAMAQNSALAAEFIRVVPKGRGVELGEIADVVGFLARPECAFITGQDISLNGGSAMP